MRSWRSQPWHCGVAVLLLAGCWSGPLELKPVERPGAVVPHVVINPASGQVPEQGGAIGGGRLTVRVVAAGSGERLVGATLAIMGPTPGYATTIASGDASFQPLEAGTYTVWATAPGRAATVVGDVAVSHASPAQVTVTLPAGGTVTGTVRDSQGAAVPGARVSMGEACALADGSGQFTLVGAPLGAQTLFAGRTGHAVAAMTLDVTSSTAAGNVTLGAGSRIVAIDNASQSFDASRTVWTALAAARAALTDAGYTVVAGSPTVADVRIVAAPSAAAYPDLAAAAARLDTHVQQGGKLVLLGEWGGFEGFSPVVLDRLARSHGIAFGGDLIRATASSTDPLAISLSGAVPGAGTTAMRLYGAGSVFAVPPAVTVGSAGSNGYRISALTADWPLVVARAHGKGMVVAVGDTTAFTDARLAEGGNRAAWLALVGW